MKNQMFSFFKAIYKKMPINYKVKNKLKGMFFRFFGVFLKIRHHIEFGIQ